MRIVRTNPNAIIPARSTKDSAGYDLYACIPETITIFPGQKLMIGTGIRMAIPSGYFGGIYARSGLSVKHGIRPATCVSVIDSDYRGEVFVPLLNEGEHSYEIHPGDRIAQIVFQKYGVFEMEEVEELDTTERGSGGFGSTDEKNN